MNSGSSNLETRSLLDELSTFNKGGLFDFGHPLVNRIAESFVKAAGVSIRICIYFIFSLFTNISLSFSHWFHIQIGVVQAVSREAYFTAIEGAGIDNNGGMPAEISSTNKNRLHGLRGRSMQFVFMFHCHTNGVILRKKIVTFVVSLSFLGETSSKSIEAMVSSSLIST